MFAILSWKRTHTLDSPWFLRLVVLATPLGFVAVETGWTVTEVGRQPWIIYGVMRTADAVTPMPGLMWSLLGTVAVYGLLTVVTYVVLRRLVRSQEAGTIEGQVPHG